MNIKQLVILGRKELKHVLGTLYLRPSLFSNPTLYAAIMVLGLSGCGSDDGGSSVAESSEAKVVSFAGQSVTFATKLQSLYEVDLSNAMYASDNGAVQLLKVENLSRLEACEPVVVTETGFSIRAEQYGACDYRYYVGRSGVELSAQSHQMKSAASLSGNAVMMTNSYGVARVAITPRETETLNSVNLTPVVHHTTISTETDPIDIKAALAAVGETIDAGFMLQATVTMPFLPASGSSVTVDTTAGTISYKPKEGFQGIERLLFSYKNSGGDVKLGALDIAVQHSLDKGFEIKDKNNSNNPSGHITYGTISDKEIGSKSFTIDISDHLVNLNTDSGCNDFQLVYIDTYNATVVPTDASNYTNNKKFNFIPSEGGSYYISFAVSNHCGTYQIGQIEIIVEKLTQEWRNIELNWMLMFTAPRTSEELDEEGITYSGSVNYNGFDVTTFNASQAETYCNSINGRVPTIDELTVLFNNPAGEPKSLADWPTTNTTPYLAKGATNGYNYSFYLDRGVASGSVPAAKQHMITCIKQGEFDMEPVGTRCMVPGGTIEYRSILLGHSEPIQNWVEVALSSKPISPMINTSARLTSNSQTDDRYFSDINGQLMFGITNTKPDQERVEVAASYDNITIGSMEDRASFGYAEVSISESAYVLLEPNGSVVAWGNQNNGGALVSYGSSVAEKLTSEVKKVVAADRAFAALKEDGSVVAWGANYWGGTFLRGTGKVEGYPASHPSDISLKVTEVADVIAGSRAFAALKEDGTVLTWGYGYDESSGGYRYAGDSSLVYDDLMDTSDPVTEVITNGEAFAALKASGKVVVWGPQEAGGDLSRGTYDGQYPTSISSILSGNVKEIFGTRANTGILNAGFAALKKNGMVVTWGGDRDRDGSFIGNSTAVYDDLQPSTVDGQRVEVQHIYSTTGAMAALKTDGSLVVWGTNGLGGDLSGGTVNGVYPANVSSLLKSGVAEVFASPYGSAFAVLKEDGEVVTWGGADNEGGNSSSVYDDLKPYTNTDGELVKVKEIFASSKAFAALKTDGTVVTWGSSEHGGDSSAVASQLTNIKKIYSNRHAFAALKEDGQVVAWGDSRYGGQLTINGRDVSSELGAGSRVRDIASHQYGQSFVAIKEDSSAVAWGISDSDTTVDGEPIVFCK